MSSKNIAISAVIVVSIITFITIFGEIYMTLQAINPITIIAAITVPIIGIAWFKKASK